MAAKNPRSALVETSNQDLSRYVFSNGVPAILKILLVLLPLGAILVFFLVEDPIRMVLGAVLIAAFVLLGFFVLIVQRATKLVVELDSSGYRIFNAGSVKAGTWDDVTDVSATPDWQRIVIRHGKIARSYISSPNGDWSAQMAELSDGIRHRLINR